MESQLVLSILRNSTQEFGDFHLCLKIHQFLEWVVWILLLWSCGSACQLLQGLISKKFSFSIFGKMQMLFCVCLFVCFFVWLVFFFFCFAYSDLILLPYRERNVGISKSLKGVESQHKKKAFAVVHTFPGSPGQWDGRLGVTLSFFFARFLHYLFVYYAHMCELHIFYFL